jgi:hypothetical protein
MNIKECQNQVFQRGFSHSYFYLEVFSKNEYLERKDLILLRIFLDEEIEFSQKLISESKKIPLKQPCFAELIFELFVPMGIYSQSIQEVNKWCISLLKKAVFSN